MPPGGTFEVLAFVRNILDEEYKAQSFDQTSSNSLILDIYGERGRLAQRLPFVSTEWGLPYVPVAGSLPDAEKRCAKSSRWAASSLEAWPPWGHPPESYVRASPIPVILHL